MNSKTGNAVEAVAVRVIDCIANSLMKQVTMENTPDGLVHNTKVFGTGDKGIMPTGKVQDEIASEEQGQERNEAGREPE